MKKNTKSDDDLKSKIDLARVYEHKDKLVQLRLHLESFQFSMILFIIGILIGIFTNFFAFAINDYFHFNSFGILIISSVILSILSIYSILQYREYTSFINSINDILDAGRRATTELENKFLKKTPPKSQ